MSEYRPLTDELPEPDPCLVLWRVAVEAYIATSSRKKGERFLTIMAEKLASEESLAEVFNIRPNSQQAMVQRARKQAVEIFGRYLPTFLGRLPPK